MVGLPLVIAHDCGIASNDCLMIVGIFLSLKQFHLPCIFFPPPPLEKMIIILIYIQMVIIDENC